MRSQFPLFNTPIDLAHHLWKDLLGPSDVVIDATSGNGRDSLALARLLEEQKGLLICIDIQKQAIEKTRSLLEQEVPSFLPRVQFLEQSHVTLPKVSAKLIVFNLGYLPSSDKSLTTNTKSTLLAVSAALDLLSVGGALSITCYPGHPEGKKEQEALLETLSTLNPLTWCFTTFFWNNRNASPSLFFVQKKCSL